MHYLYYCNSSYQLINVLNLHWQRQNLKYENVDNYSADLIMLNAYEGAKELANILLENKVFNDTKVVERVKNDSKFHLFNTIGNIIFPKIFISNSYKISYKELSNKYDYICTPKFNKLIACIWQLNRKAKLQMHEDGIGTYISDLGNNYFSKSYKLLYKLFNYGRDFSDIDAIYVNNKDLYSNNREELVKEIPKLSKDSINTLLYYFEKYAKCERNEKNIYWLSQIMTNENNKNVINNILFELNKYHSNVVYCPHPRNYVEDPFNFDKSISKQIWELKILNMKRINNNCLVSSHSTACFTPYILYGYEPFLILTYKLISDEDISNKNNFDVFIEKLKKKYKDKTKIMVPNTIEEYIDCLMNYDRLQK